MILTYTALLSAIFILSEAAVIDPGTTLTAQISGEIPKAPDTEEKWEKNKHLHTSKNNYTDSDDLNETENNDIDAKQEIKYNSVTHNDDNKLGHEKKIDTNISDHKHLERNRTVDGETADGDHNARTDQEYDDQMNIHETETDQSLRDGSLHTEQEDKVKKTNDHVVTTSETNNTCDEDHATDLSFTFDDNHQSNVKEHEGMTERKIEQPGNNIVITDTTDVVHKKDYDTHNHNLKIDKDTPFFHKTEEKRVDSVDSNDNTVTTAKTNVVWDTPLSKVKITDEIKEEHNNENKKDEEQDEKFLYDDNGDGKFVREKSYKEVTDETKEHINTVTLETDPKLSKAIPLKVVLTNSAVDEQHIHMNEKNEQEIQSITPTTEIEENTIEESTSKYDFNPIANEGHENNNTENDSTIAGITIKSQNNNNDTQDEEANGQCNKDSTTDSQRDDDKHAESSSNQDDGNHDSMVLMIIGSIEESTIQ